MKVQGSIAQKVTMYTIIALVVGTFIAFFGIPGGREGVAVVASVDGQTIPLEIFHVYREGQTEQEQRLRGLGLPARDVRQAIDRQVINFLVQQQLMAHEAERLGFRVSDDELRTQMCENPLVRQGGRCDPRRVAQLRAAQGFQSERSYVNTLSQELLVQKLVRFLEDPVHISDAQALEQLRRERTTLQLDYVALRADAFKPEIKLEEAEVTQFASSAGQRINDAYQLRISEFQRPEQVHVHHILFTGDQAEAQAEAAKARLAAGETFEDLAKELSQDPASSDLGGDLNFLSKEQMLPPFAEAAFAAQPNQVVGPVKTERGLHVLRVDERRPALDVKLEQATPQLARELLTADRAAELAKQRSEALSKAIASGTPLRSAAEALKLEVQQTTAFNTQVRTIPGMDPVAGLREAALALRPDHPASDKIFGEKDVFYLISLAKREEPKEEDLKSQLADARTRMETEQRQQLGNELARSLYKTASEGGRIKTYDPSGSGAPDSAPDPEEPDA